MKKVLLGGAEMWNGMWGVKALTEDIPVSQASAGGESEICGLSIGRKWISIAFYILQAPCDDNNPTSASVLPSALFIGLNKYRTGNKSCELLRGLTQAEENIIPKVYQIRRYNWLNILVQVRSVNNTAFIPQDGDKRFKIPLGLSLTLAACMSINWQ